MGKFWKSFLQGMASIGEGMSQISIYPMPPLPVPRKWRGRTCKDDAEALQGDWAKVSGDMNNVVNDLDKAIEKAYDGYMNEITKEKIDKK